MNENENATTEELTRWWKKVKYQVGDTVQLWVNRRPYDLVASL